MSERGEWSVDELRAHLRGQTPQSAAEQRAHQVGMTLVALAALMSAGYLALSIVLGWTAERDCRLLGYGGGGWSLGTGYCVAYHNLEGPARR